MSFIIGQAKVIETFVHLLRQQAPGGILTHFSGKVDAQYVVYCIPCFLGWVLVALTIQRSFIIDEDVDHFDESGFGTF